VDKGEEECGKCLASNISDVCACTNPLNNNTELC
jgi:hypothetical protein